MADTVKQWQERWQSDQAAGPVAQRVILENDRVRIWEIVLAPSEELAVHTHAQDYVIVLIEESEMEVREHTGELRTTHGTPGDTQFTAVGEGQTHSLKNVGSTRFRNRLIELKQ